MNEQKHNGWTNYETWNAALWLDNSEYDYIYWTRRAQEVLDESRADATFTQKERAAFGLEEEIKEVFESTEGLPENGWMADAINAYLSEVNWYEIAAHYLAELEVADALED